MRELKKWVDGIVSIIAGCGILLVCIAWIVTFLALTFGLSIWSTQWFWSLI